MYIICHRQKSDTVGQFRVIGNRNLFPKTTVIVLLFFIEFCIRYAPVKAKRHHDCVFLLDKVLV